MSSISRWKRTISDIENLDVVRDFQSCETTKAVRRLEDRMSSHEGVIPETLSLEEAYTRIAEQHLQGLSFHDLPLQYQRMIPWLIFYSPESEHPLGVDPGFLSSISEYQHHLRFLRPGFISALIMTLLRVYPSDSPLLPDWLNLACRALSESDSIRLKKWKVRNNTYKLLWPEGPRMVASLFLASGLTFEELAKDLGLAGNLRGTNFLNKCLSECLIQMTQCLTSESTKKDIVRIIDLLEDSTGNLRTKAMNSLIQDSLLLPWLRHKPNADAQGEIRRFLLKHFEDPRTSQGWYGACEDAKAVIRKWIVGQTIGAFFSIIRKTALPHQWNYRQAFWDAYLQKEYIDDAWVILGKNAEANSRNLLHKLNLDFGRLLPGIGSLPDQSVLIIRIGDLLITEGSHNWTCRFWRHGSRSAPKLYGRVYSRSDLVDHWRWEQRHHGSENFTWQSSIAGFIEAETGRRITRSEYMP